MRYFLLAVFVSLSGLALAQTTINQANSPAMADGTQIPVTFTGGYDTYGPDRGRPVVLIASALKVPPEVFRKVFSGVKPAGPGQQPEPDQVRKNKQVLLEGLGPYGVTDDRLNEVSNYYRYSRSRGEMWRTTPAAAYATVHDGKIVGVTITNGGSGYSSVPTVTIPGWPDLSTSVKLAYDTEFAKNGSVTEIKVGPAATAPNPVTP